MICQCLPDQYYLPQPSDLANAIDLLTADKSQYFAQPHPIHVIVNCCLLLGLFGLLFLMESYSTGQIHSVSNQEK